MTTSTSPSRCVSLQATVDDRDRIRMGNLDTVRMGVGTISWNATDAREEVALSEIAAEVTRFGSFFDTAERYGSELGPPFDSWPFSEPGRCERILGESLGHAKGSDSPRIVATKFTPVPWRMSAQAVVDACQASAKRLNVESVDLYQLHHPDIVKPFKAFGLDDSHDDVLWEGLAECVKQGLARNVGVSNYGPSLLGRAQEALGRQGVELASNQINMSLLYRRNGVMETLDYCNRCGVALLAYWPLTMGLLTGATNLPHTGDRGKDLNHYLNGGGRIPDGGIQPLLAVLKSIAAKRDKSCSQVALNWVISKGAVPIPGARTIERFREYAGALGWRLTDAEVGQLDEASDALPFDFEGAGRRLSSGKFVGYGIEKWQLD